MADSLSTSSDASMTATQRNVARTRDDLIGAAVRLVERSEEPTMRAVAAAAGVGERTVYRYFESREGLAEAVAEAIGPRLGVPLCASLDELHDYVDALFAVFEANHGITVATVTSPWVQPYLAQSRSRNLRDMTDLVRSAFPGVDPDELTSAAAALRTALSGAGWVYQRESCALPAAAVVANAHWLVDTVTARLARLAESPPG
ncbi:MAG: TetR family transcriptional regulator [Acidimicrobiia bacterium]|nr:TetR family transcriptional regulator [Acidimicrobiia bacterium]